MNDLQVRRWAGTFGVAGLVVFLVALPLYFLGVGPAAPLEDTSAFSDVVARTGTYILARTALADPLIMVGLLVFLAGFRFLIRQARPDYEWIAALVFGVGVLVIGIELVADGLEAGAALDTVVKADPTAVRALMEGSFPLFGSIGLILSALLLAAAGYATLATRVLPSWTGWFACAAAALNLAAAPSIFGGTDITGFYTASGYAPFVGQAAMLVWFLFASISMLVAKPEARPTVEPRARPKAVASKPRRRA